MRRQTAQAKLLRVNRVRADTRVVASKLELRGAHQKDEAQATVRRITGELADLTQTAMREAADVLRNGTRAVRRASGHHTGQLRRALNDLTTTLERHPGGGADPQPKVEDDLHELGVRSVAIPRRSKPSAARRELEHRPAFREKVKWRTGSEDLINHTKRSYGWNRTELVEITDARIWSDTEYSPTTWSRSAP